MFIFFHFFAKNPHFCSYSLVLSLSFTLSTLHFTPIFKISISFPFLIPCLIPPREPREMTERRAHQLPVKKKLCFLRLRPYKVVLTLFLKTLTYLFFKKKSHQKRFFLLNPKKSSNFAKTFILWKCRVVPLHRENYIAHEKIINCISI